MTHPTLKPTTITTQQQQQSSLTLHKPDPPRSVRDYIQPQKLEVVRVGLMLHEWRRGLHKRPQHLKHSRPQSGVLAGEVARDLPVDTSVWILTV